MDAETGMDRFAPETTPLHGAAVIQVRPTDRIVHDAQRPPGLKQGTVMVETPHSRFHTRARHACAAPRDDVDHSPHGVRTVDRRERTTDDLDALDVIRT